MFRYAKKLGRGGSDPGPLWKPPLEGGRDHGTLSATEYGHGWIQGAGHGVMTVRFETRSTGPGPVHTFPDDTPGIDRANPVDSLDWPDYVSELAARSAPAGDDVLDG